MNTENPKPKINAGEALKLLEQAWAYYTPEPMLADKQPESRLFEYANAA
ncbi:hypothetical protein [uncultured Ruegeria sp.]|jgi:hypothetical protein|nr:hypothetical protein [uncultured Ruegeria sp.]